MHAARQARANVPSLQEATGIWMKQYKKGRFEVTVDTSKLEPHIEALRGITQTLVVGPADRVGILISSVITAGSVPENSGGQGHAHRRGHRLRSRASARRRPGREPADAGTPAQAALNGLPAPHVARLRP